MKIADDELGVSVFVKSLCLYCRASDFMQTGVCVCVCSGGKCISRSFSLLAGGQYRTLVQKDTMRWQLRLADQAEPEQEERLPPAGALWVCEQVDV